MPTSTLSITLRRLWALNSFAYSIRVAIALAVLMAGCWSLDHMPAVVPLFLGVVACALAETDDNWRGRAQALLLTLACFAAAAFAVQAVFAQHTAFVVVLVVATFGLTMLGAISRRYQAIAYGTLILSIYTAIGMDQRGDTGQAFWLEPALLLAGASWYGLLSVIWCALFLHQPVQQNLAQLMRELERYLRLKSTLFEPVRDHQGEVRRIQLAQQSGRVVMALNQAKETIFNRVDATRPGSRMKQYLHLYFIAQDIHERASSSHYPYDALIEAFFHSDVLFRCQRLMRVQGRECGALARAILLRVPYVKGEESAAALQDLHSSIDQLQAHQQPQWAGLLGSLNALADNLGTLDAQLAEAGQPEAPVGAHDGALYDRTPRSWADALGRVREQFRLSSPLLRHALRLSLALALGYVLMRTIHARQGYWILLTTVFVCQPNFNATRQRMLQRVSGTFLGLAIGWALFDLFPSLLLQAMFAVVAGVVFFSTRTTRYTVATASMTLVVLMCFNQTGDSGVLIVPRMVDTLIGSALAGAAVYFILPDWQGRRLDALAGRALAALAVYLRELTTQYRRGRLDDLAYRLARRNAHNADAALSTAMTNLLAEPGRRAHEGDRGLRFMVHSHTVLNYLSGLGAHRAQLAEGAESAALLQSADHIAALLKTLADSLAQGQPHVLEPAALQRLIEGLPALPDGADAAQRLVAEQLRLICGQLAPLGRAAAALATAEMAAIASDDGGDRNAGAHGPAEAGTIEASIPEQKP
ncbi:YccS family putative transporter [Variovorax sp. J22G21]|uniref:YccS family putative transporter n=1 Tax=Variovorax fucosicus TaxID=3053517 RepID=UPI00257605D9|nr:MULTISPECIES: YccS family putative transporter [unclassified Variovorax]MDM0040130.1 YccS family putative transporter [Variovorax sp. J22R193]MDM0061503.1 YccS family putative transporter [Variovorax sp. J22G21]